MPAEIDTGGPRVLHCDYRADCPIPIVESASIVSEYHEDRQITTSLHRDFSTIRQASGDQNESLVDFSTIKSSFSASLCRSKLISATTTLRFALRPPSRRRASSESRTTELDLPNDQDPARTPELWFNERLPPWTISNPEIHKAGKEYEFREEDRLKFRSNFPWEEFQKVDTPLLSLGESVLSSHRSEDPVEKWEDVTLSLNITDIEKHNIQQLDSSSYGKNHRYDCKQRDQETSRDSSSSSKKLKRVCPKNRSYFQLALLLFLVAFGQSGLLKSGVLNPSAKSSTTGLSVLAIGTVIGAVSAAPIDLMADAGVRAERSANLSHITGASRKIQMYIKNKHLQILPDGTVNGSNDDTSDYTIFQRTSVSRGQLRIQGVATCLYLCMDSCGLLYGSREYTEDCVFNETLEQHNYNTYSSVRWSTGKKTLYLGLNRRGQPRRVQAKGHNLGRLSAYARVLTQVAPPDRVEALQRRMMGAQHNVRHRHNARGGQHHHRGDVIQQSLCPSLPTQEKDGRDRFRCRKRKKRKKKKRRCKPGEKPGPQCLVAEDVISSLEFPTTFGPLGDSGPPNGSSIESKRSCEDEASEEACRREALSVPSKKRKLRVEETSERNNSNGKNKATNAKKVNVAGSMNQSKKPNLTDGKKRKKKVMAPIRRTSSTIRKRPGPSTAMNRYAQDMATTELPSTTSSSQLQHPVGVSTVRSTGKGVSPRRRKLSSSSNNQYDHHITTPVYRSGTSSKVGKILRIKNGPKIILPSIATEVKTTMTTIPYPYLRESSSIVPDASFLDRSDIETGTSDSPLLLETSTEPVESETIGSSWMETLSGDEVPLSTTTSAEYLDSTSDVASIGATSAPEIFRLLEDDSKSVEDVSEDDSENGENGKFATTEGVLSSSPRLSLERLAM